MGDNTSIEHCANAVRYKLLVPLPAACMHAYAYTRRGYENVPTWFYLLSTAATRHRRANERGFRTKLMSKSTLTLSTSRQPCDYSTVEPDGGGSKRDW